jgi:hypothetical protein
MKVHPLVAIQLLTTVNLIRGTQIAYLDRSSIKNIINGRHENLVSFFKSIIK